MLTHAGLLLDFLSLSLFGSGLWWLHILSDSLMALAYFLVPIVMVRSVRGRGEVPFNSTIFCIMAFIVACGVTHHLLDVLTLWHPAIWAGGLLKAATASIALTTFLLLLRLMPTILAIPSHTELKEILSQRTVSVLESTTVCVIAVDSAWKIVYMNRNATALVSVGRDIRGMSMWEAFPAQRQEERDALIESMEKRRSVSFESYYAPLDLSTVTQAHPWDDGGIAVFFSDVSEQKRLQRELELERATRHQRIEMLARFSAGLAHEIRNPLAVINARASDLAELAAEGDELPAALVANACDSIVKTADRAIRILRGLEALARDGAHDPMQVVDVGTMVELAVELVERRYKAHDIALLTVVPGGLPKVECRDVQIGQVLTNLLSNAFDAVDASPDSERWVRVEASMQRCAEEAIARLLIDVVDGGPALAEETKEHMMEAFYTTKILGAGMGVGLSVSQAIAEDHGGGLKLHDRDGHTCFRLSLPVHAARAEEAAA